MSLVAGALPPPSRGGGGSPPAPTGGPPDCREAHCTQSATTRKRRKMGANLGVDVTAGSTVEPGIPSLTPMETRVSFKRSVGRGRLGARLSMPDFQSMYRPPGPQVQPPTGLGYPAAVQASGSTLPAQSAVQASGSTLQALSTPTPLGFLPRGRDSGDTPETAAARHDRNVIQRDHRHRERAALSEPPATSQLDPLSGFYPFNYEADEQPHPVLGSYELGSSYRGRGRQQGDRNRDRSSLSSRSLSPVEEKLYFLCRDCTYPRQNYHLAHSTEQDELKQLVWCIPLGRHEFPLEQFFDDNDLLHYVCRQCQAVEIASDGVIWTQSSPAPGSSQADLSSRLRQQNTSSWYGSSLNPDGSLSRRSSFRHGLPSGPNPGEADRRNRENIEAMDLPDPVIDISSADWQNSASLGDRDWKLLQRFHARMDKETMEDCTRCSERWFKMELNGDGVCSACIKADKDIDPGQLYMFTADNLMDPGPMPGTLMLPMLSQVEELLIARVHCFVEVRQIRGQQYKYRGYIVNFLNNTGKVYNTLPLLPQDLDIIIIRPKNWNTDERMRQ
ncbi:hypothetical protein BKA63DRAFT_486263 [Paraphoma chrysanthemicola]|nr:hypothetical protein BKA63DRAFT_486263 [Paraphoma chrysanthemicola]